MGRLEAIWVKRFHRGPMDVVQTARVTERGVDGSAGNSRARAVTIIEREVWEELMREMGTGAEPAGRRANLMVSGLPLHDSRGRVLQVGGARLQIGGATMPCERMDALVPGLQEAMRERWRGGAYAQVLQEGAIAVGDEVRWVDE